MSDASVQEIADWLEKLGMSEYAQRFAENGIGAAALRYLTDQDLKDIGVLLGHRRVMLAAIGKLGGPAATAPARAATVEPEPQDTAELLQQAPSPVTATATSVSAAVEAAGDDPPRRRRRARLRAPPKNSRRRDRRDM
jgi:hypothetical protein